MSRRERRAKRFGVTPIASVLSTVLPQVANTPEAKLFAEWPQVVGATIAGVARPAKLMDKELWVDVEEAVWRQTLQVQSVEILRRITEHCGAGLVTSLRFGQAPPWRKTQTVRTKDRRALHIQVSPEVEDYIEELVDRIPDEGTRESLRLMLFRQAQQLTLQGRMQSPAVAKEVP